MDFVHLHAHSHYSLLDGLPTPEAIVAFAKKQKARAVALTDSGVMYGAIEFSEACLKEGVKPIIGFEAFVGDEGHHLTLLAENYDGYRRLMVLCSLGHTEGAKDGKPRLTKAMLREHAGYIIALSGCIHGEIPRALRDDRVDDAERAAREYAEIFGQDYFYLELQDHPAIAGQVDVNAKLTALGEKCALPLVVTRDVHYLKTDDAEAQDILTCIREGWKVGDASREDLRQVDRSMNTGDDILSRFRHIPQALENTVRIADRVAIEIPLNQWHFADIDLPEGVTADEELARRARTCLPNFYDPVTPEIAERLEYELGIIQKKGYSPYFICVSDYVSYAKAHGIVETTRGSAAGSLVSFVIGITTVDPIRFKLPFERFLNPFRPSPPDIDTDFADDRREEMIAYVTEKYGKDRVAQIITFGTMAARASVRDVGRALGLAYSFCDQVAKLIPMGAQGFPMTIARALKEEPDLKKLYDANADVKRLLTLAEKVEGCARHTSIHAAGVVIAPTPLTDFTPIQYEVGGTHITTQYEMHAVETAGVLKMDFLGIRNLSILGKAVEIVAKTAGDRIDIYHLPLDDRATFEMLSRGETMGTFQLGGSGMTRWLKELKPSTIDDIMAMVALYRPGPMESIPEYIRRKHDSSTVEYLDPRMEAYLGASFGLLVYQDDVLLTAITLAGYDWMEADKFRKAIGKKIPEEMEKQKKKFFDGCREYGKLPEEKIERLWQLIEPFAAYGFNKAHAASYGMVAYQTAYMKAHYPVQYMTAVLQAEAGDAEKVAAIVYECSRMGIEVLPPDVNESFRNFAMVSKHGEPGRIRFGLTAVKNVGEHICEVIYAERKANGSYKDLEHFLRRVQDKDLNKKSLESLVQAGALDGFGYDRGVLLGNTEQLLSFARETRETAATNQHSLFSGTPIAFDDKVVLKHAEPATMDDKLHWEKSLLGLYVSSHPFAVYDTALRGSLLPLSAVEGQPRDSWVVVGGVIDGAKKKITKKGSVMMFATLQDMSGSMELLVFPKTFEATQDVWKDGATVAIVGKTPKEVGDNKIFVERAYVLTPETVESVASQLAFARAASTAAAAPAAPSAAPEKFLLFRMTKDAARAHAEAMKKLFHDYPGDYAVYVEIDGQKIRTSGRMRWDDDAARALTERLPTVDPPQVSANR
jgi:DNA polymerase-3 subunit alpha